MSDTHPMEHVIRSAADADDVMEVHMIMTGRELRLCMWALEQLRTVYPDARQEAERTRIRLRTTFMNASSRRIMTIKERRQ